MSDQILESRAERHAFFKSISLFAGLDELALTNLEDAFEEQRWAEGQRIVAEGDTGHHLYVVRRGSAAAEMGEGADRLPLALFKPGDFFGELALLDGEPRSATVRATSTCQVLRLPRNLFLGLVDKHPKVLWNICLEFARRIRATSHLARSGAGKHKVHASRDE